MTTYTLMSMFAAGQTDGATLLRTVLPTQLELIELALMDADLEACRSHGCPFRLTVEQEADIERERPGHELCTNPWGW
jgi:hypothetical protein